MRAAARTHCADGDNNRNTVAFVHHVLLMGSAICQKESQSQTNCYTQWQQRFVHPHGVESIAKTLAGQMAEPPCLWRPRQPLWWRNNMRLLDGGGRNFRSGRRERQRRLVRPVVALAVLGAGNSIASWCVPHVEASAGG